MGSRGARRGTPRTAIPTSHVKDGARPSAPVLRRDPPRPIPVPASNRRVAVGSTVLIEDSEGKRYELQVTPEGSTELATGRAASESSKVGRGLLGRAPGDRVPGLGTPPHVLVEISGAHAPPNNRMPPAPPPPRTPVVYIPTGNFDSLPRRKPWWRRLFGL